jgi:hypothetical protein
MTITQRTLILDLYLFDETGNIAGVNRKKDDPLLANTLTMIILELPVGEHPISYLKKYLADKHLEVLQMEMLPSFYQNWFDSEPTREYLVLSFKTVVKGEQTIIQGDHLNRNISFTSVSDFLNNPRLMPEFKKFNLGQVMEGKPLYTKGKYRDSDFSNEVLEWIEV